MSRATSSHAITTRRGASGFRMAGYRFARVGSGGLTCNPGEMRSTRLYGDSAVQLTNWPGFCIET